MKLAPVLLSSLLLSSLAVAGCAADPAAPGDVDAADETNVSQDELQARAQKFVGAFDWDAASDFVDFESLELKADGSYAATVDSGLVNPAVRCIRFPCTLPESGHWTTVKSGSSLKIKVDPTGAKPARSYVASISNAGVLSLTRYGMTTKLEKRAAATCASVRCASGTHCEMKGINGGSIPVCLNDAPLPACVKSGCSGQICADSARVSTCEWRPEYACYHDATCERQADGACGWTKTPALTSCLGSH